MALAFNQTKGGAQKNNIDQYEYRMGENKIRIFGPILPRYIYWIKGLNNKSIPFECLSFNRETETFDNAEKDYVREFFPDLKCGWAYAIQGFDMLASEGERKAQVVNLKKKLLGEIISAAETLGDPTDPDAGWDIVFKKVKTGPLPYNVEYQLQALKCVKRPLTDAEKELIAEAKSIDEQLPRPTPDAQKALLERIQNEDAEDSGMDSDVKEEFDVE
jgi:hypothetical protein